MIAPPISVAEAGVSPNASHTQIGPKIVSVCASTVWAAAGTCGAPRRKSANPSPITRNPALNAAMTPDGDGKRVVPFARQTPVDRAQAISP